MTRARTDGGFLLLEVLAAFVIAALALIVLLEGASGGLRATSLANRYGQAIARARSHLGVMGGRAAPLVPGVQEGDDGSGFHWRVQVTSLAAASSPGPRRQALFLYRIVVTETWQGESGERNVQLTSARFSSGQPPGP